MGLKLNKSFSLNLFSQSLLGFNVTLHRPPDGSWGSLRNGTWTGMVGMVVRGQCHMAMSEFTMTQQRRQVVDYSMPLMDDTVHFAMLRPQQAKSWTIFVDIFNWAFWLTLAGLCFMVI